MWFHPRTDFLKSHIFDRIYYHRIFVNCGYAMSTPDRSIENDKTLIGKNNSFRDQSLGSQDTITNENKRGEEFPEASHGMDLKSRYEIISSIGQGGMGHVYLAQDRTLARKVAIKRIKSQSDSTVRRFLVEARAIAQVTHYNIVQIFDYGHDADGPYLILEYVDGGTLADLLKAGPLKVDQSINITCRLAEGLVKAHELGIIHRDIKPANILMTKDGQPKLTDFGLARDEHTDSAHTVTGAILGTIDFMSPEQLNDATATDARSDLWSLAVTFYQMVTGKSPRMIKFNLLPSNLKDFVIKALEDDPAERYQTAREFVDNLIRQNNSPAVNHINMDYIQTDDLQTGECTNCHVVNESIRKYCRRCGNRLRLNCLECGTEMPVWDKICGECGGNQSTIMRATKIKCENFILECEDLLSNYAFDEAERVLQEIQAIDKTRFESYFVLFDDIQSRINQSRQEIQVYISKSWDESQILSKTNRYQEAVNLFKMLPDKILGSEIKEKMSEWNQKIIEIEQLSNDIERALKQNNYNGLLRKIERLISIGNTNGSYLQIRDSLKERNANSKIEFTQLISNAERLRGKGDLKNAADLLANAVSILNRQITEDNHDYEAPTKLLDITEKTRCLTIYQLALSYERSLECDQALSVLDNIPSEYNKVEHQGKLYEKSTIIQNIEISRRKIEKYDDIKRKIEKCIDLSRYDQFHSLIQELQSIEDPQMEVYAKWAIDINLKVQSEIKDLDEFLKNKRDESYSRAVELLNEGKAINAWNLIKDIDIGILTEKHALVRNETEIISSFELKILEHDKLLGESIQTSSADCMYLLNEVDDLLERFNGSKPLIDIKDKICTKLSKFTGNLNQSRIITNSIGYKMRYISPGEFQMGSNIGFSSEKPVRKIRIDYGFFIGLTEVTQEQFSSVMGNNPSEYRNPNYPVENVSWEDAQVFCNKMSDIHTEKSKGYLYRLPHEAEWEYACRAGSQSEFNFGDDHELLDDYAWYDRNSSGSPHEVATKKPNCWGLYDMHGNVMEWCQEIYYPYSGLSQDLSLNLNENGARIYRGGGWSSIAYGCRSSYRFRRSRSPFCNGIGFRVVMRLAQHILDQETNEFNSVMHSNLK